MNFLQGMNQAIQYIESNLDSKIDYEKAAGMAGYSSFYFQRIFACIAGISLADYVKRRRMTLVAFELQNSNIKILDLAIKYGYESGDSFARAFQTIHGITPSVARREGIALKAFSPMTFYISIKGECGMDYRIETKKVKKRGINRKK